MISRLPVPWQENIRNCPRHLCEHGSFKPPPGTSGRPRSTTPDTEDAILDAVAQNPRISTRQVDMQMNVPRVTVWWLLREQQLYPYHLQQIQALAPKDSSGRLTICQWFIQQHDMRPNFPALVLWTGWGNVQAWWHSKFAESAWVGICQSACNSWTIPSTKILHQDLGRNSWWLLVRTPCTSQLPDRQRYRWFLCNKLPLLLEDIPLAVQQEMYFMHDGAPANFSRIVLAHLNCHYLEHWVGRSGPIAWPPCSPDLNPLDFFVWGHLKSLVYSTAVEDEATLHARIVQGCQRIGATPSIFEHVRTSMWRRAEACSMAEGGHFEQFL